MNVAKAKLEGPFADELTLLQPMPGYMRLRIDRQLHAARRNGREGILAFAERLLPSAANTWIQASLEQQQRLQA